MTDLEESQKKRLEEQATEIKALQQQMVALDRILSGRRVIDDSIASEGLLLRAPFIELFDLDVALRESGSPPQQWLGPIQAIRVEGMRIQLTGGHQTIPVDLRLFGREQTVRGAISSGARLVLAIINNRA